MVDEAPVLDGPVDLAALACDNGLRVDRARIGLKARGAPTLDGGEADLAVDGGWLRYGCLLYTSTRGFQKAVEKSHRRVLKCGRTRASARSSVAA